MRTGVILLNMGGPAGPSEVRPFLDRLFSDREIIRLPVGRVGQPVAARLISALRQTKVRKLYEKIGGGSPILAHTRAQAQGLFLRLQARGLDARVAIAMRYAAPRADEALDRLERAGVDNLLALTLYPQYSQATTWTSLLDLERARERRGSPHPFRCIDRFGAHPGYLDALAERVRVGLEGWPSERRGNVVILFSAHSLPMRFVEEGDPYVSEIRQTVRGVLDRLRPGQPWRLGFQSQVGPVRWVGPSTEHVIETLAGEGVRDILAVPVAFVSDHLETLYEMDMLYGDLARERGITEFRRAESLNDSPLFLDALADMVVETVG